MNLIRYFNLDRMSSSLGRCAMRWACFFSGPRLGHECGEGDNWAWCKHCKALLVNY